jgi:hypothetical protein
MNTTATLLSVTRSTPDILTACFAELLGVLVGGGIDVEAMEFGEGFAVGVAVTPIVELIAGDVKAEGIVDPEQN